MSDALIKSELARCRALLAPRRTGVPLTEVAPECDPASLGAVGGIGFEAKDPDVVASVYFFETVARHADAIAQLKRALPQAEGMATLHGANGRMLFFGQARVDGPQGEEAEFRLGDIAGAFGGDEE